jgi:hypothetical protein
MKRLGWIRAAAFGLAAIATTGLSAEGDARSVTGAGKGTFATEATLGAVVLSGVELGTGVFIEADGSASGTFHAALHGSALGAPRAVTVEGTVGEGSVASDGLATFSGTASIDFGDGTPPLPSVPFRVTAGSDGVVLVIDSTTLPAAALTAGGVTVN